jgi:hypothetical protein
MTQIDELLSNLTAAQRDSLMEAAVREAARRAQNAGRPLYTSPEGIVRYVREVLHAEPAPYQERILRNLVTYGREAVKSPHGAGKTALAAWVTLWAVDNLGDDVKVVTTASAWRQLELYLWPEIRKWAKRANLNPRPAILHMALRYDGMAKGAFAVASDTPELIEGAHADKIVYILDEAKAIPPAFWDSVEGALSTGDAYVLAISTPGLPSGRFYQIHKREPGFQDWHTDSITLEEAIAAGRIKPKWVSDRRKQWGETSAVYQSRVLGNFADSGEDAVIPLSWVEQANERWLACNGQGSGELAWGCDPARFGGAVSSIAQLRGCVLEKLHRDKAKSTMETTGKLVNLVGDKNARIAVDIIGLGAGIFDRLRELEFENSIGINVSRAPVDENEQPITGRGGQEFYNLRSALWWLLREALDPEGDDPLALPLDDKLVGDLTAPTYLYTSNGKIRVEGKDDIRARIGRSTDDADALALALYAARANSGVVFAAISYNKPFTGLESAWGL